MNGDTEKIEAKLAAYIDGDLPPSDRAEIEKYLVANPQHKKLIGELMSIKTATGLLPREKAPAEVLDHLQANLERHALLEDVEDAGGSMKINRWPQWTAVAAMLFLTVGLGVLVYLVLPRGEFDRNQIVLAPPSVQRLPTNPSLSEMREDETKDGMAEMPVASKARALEDAAAPTTSLAFTKGSDEAAPQHLTLNNGSAIVVQTDDPVLTQNLVAGYLGQNKFQFEPVDNTFAITGGYLARINQQASANFVLPNNGATPIGDLVGKLKQAEPKPVNNESYLVVRNVSSSQAEELSKALGDQRGGRQQARFYSNADLNSAGGNNKLDQELKLNAPSVLNSAPGTQYNANGGFGGGAMSKSTHSSDADQLAGLKQQDAVAEHVENPATRTPASTLPTSQPSETIAQAEATPADGSQNQQQIAPPVEQAPTDILIVVQASELPASTQPASEPAAIVPTTAPTTAPTTIPTTSPATMPAVP